MLFNSICTNRRVEGRDVFLAELETEADESFLSAGFKIEMLFWVAGCTFVVFVVGWSLWARGFSFTAIVNRFLARSEYVELGEQIASSARSLATLFVRLSSRIASAPLFVALAIARIGSSVGKPFRPTIQRLASLAHLLRVSSDRPAALRAFLQHRR